MVFDKFQSTICKNVLICKNKAIGVRQVFDESETKTQNYYFWSDAILLLNPF